MANLGFAGIPMSSLRIIFFLVCFHLFVGKSSAGHPVEELKMETELEDVMVVYYFYDFRATWNKAYNTCAERNASLLQIDSSYIWDIILYLDDTVFNNQFKKHDVWIGMVATNNTHMIWTDTCDYLNVTENYQRLDVANVGTGCMLSHKHTLEWVTNDCSKIDNFICQYQNKNETCGMSDEEVVYVDYMQFSLNGECRASCFSNKICWAYYVLNDLGVCLFLLRSKSSLLGIDQMKVMYAKKICYRGEKVPVSENPPDTGVDEADSSIPDYHCDTETKDNADGDINFEINSMGYGLQGNTVSCDCQQTVTVTVNAPDTSTASRITSEVESCSPCASENTVLATASPVITTSIQTVCMTASRITNEVESCSPCAFENIVLATASPITTTSIRTVYMTASRITSEVESCSPSASENTVLATASPTITTSILTVYMTSTCVNSNDVVINSVEASPSCSLEKTFTSVPAEVLQESLSQLAKELTVDKKTTSAYLRAKTSAKDKRPSAVTIGGFGVLMLALPALFILVLDLSRFAIHMKDMNASCKVKQNP